jgi:hypothetical protein
MSDLERRIQLLDSITNMHSKEAATRRLHLKEARQKLRAMPIVAKLKEIHKRKTNGEA